MCMHAYPLNVYPRHCPLYLWSCGTRFPLLWSIPGRLINQTAHFQLAWAQRPFPPLSPFSCCFTYCIPLNTAAPPPCISFYFISCILIPFAFYLFIYLHFIIFMFTRLGCIFIIHLFNIFILCNLSCIFEYRFILMRMYIFIFFYVIYFYCT